MVKRLLQCVFCLLLAWPAFAQAPDLSASVDRTEVSINDVFTLSIRIDTDLGSGLPAMDGLEQDFEQVGMSRSSNYTNTNGQVRSWNEYRISLRPRTTGTLTIPAFRMAGETTEPIDITVSDAPRNPANASEEFFLSTEINKDSLYVQEQLLYTVKLYYRSSFDQGARLSAPQLDNAVIQQLGSDNNYQEIVDGIRYNVTERRFVLFPQSSGQAEISPVDFDATIGSRRSSLSSIFSTREPNAREISISSEAHAINVLAKPASYPADATWLPASDFELSEEWSGPRDALEVGESVTRNLSMRANGLSSSLLPDFNYADVDGLNFYPDQPDRRDRADRDGVIGIREEGTAIVASQAGEFTLPAIEIPWWNTRTDSLEIARLPARTLNILPVPGQDRGNNGQETDTPAGDAENTALSDTDQDSGSYAYWITATAIFALAWLFSTYMWLRYRQFKTAKQSASREEPADAEAAFKAFNKACAKGELATVRQELISWGRAFYQDSRLLSLESLKTRIGKDDTAQLLDELENALYSPSGQARPPRLDALQNSIATIHKAGAPSRSTKASSYSLPPLYKN